MPLKIKSDEGQEEEVLEGQEEEEVDNLEESEEGTEEDDSKDADEEEESGEESSEDLSSIKESLANLAQKLEEIKPKPAAETKPVDTKPSEFVTQEELTGLLDNPANLNKVLSRVYNQGKEDTLKSIPGIVEKLINQSFTLNTLVTQFYQENADLKPYRKYVGFVTNKLQSEHPDWDLDKVMKETEKQVRVDMGRKKGSDKNARNRRTHSRIKTEAQSRFQKEFDSLTKGI